MQLFCNAFSGFLFLFGFIPYIASVLRGETKPAKASWIIWLSLDLITLFGMLEKHVLNAQVVGAATGSFIVTLLAFKFGTPGWTKWDKVCLAGSAFGLVLWYLSGEPLFGIAMAGLTGFVGSIPTIIAVWCDPFAENGLGWMLWFVSCFFAALGVESWNWTSAIQIAVFTIIEGTVTYVIYFRPFFLSKPVEDQFNVAI